MLGFQATVREFVFGIPQRETTFARRGFRASQDTARKRLEHIGEVFLYGYHAALSQQDPEALNVLLGFVERGSCGFAFEGAAMGLSLLDCVLPWKKGRLNRFLRGPGQAHAYMVHAGAGWAHAKMGHSLRSSMRYVDRFDRLLRWLIVDGYGFCKGYFDWKEYVAGVKRKSVASDYAGRAFDQGLGRSLWFVEGADVCSIGKRIASFPEPRRADLWSGVGLACAYAGGVDRGAVMKLRDVADTFRPEVAQGAAFAAKARQRAGNPTDHTEMACQVLCGIPAGAAARLTDETRESLPEDSTEPAYEEWRRRIQWKFRQATR